MLKELTILLEKQIKDIIVYDNITFIESKRFKKNDNSLYLIFALYNRKIRKVQKLTYCVKTRLMQFNLHDEHLYIIND